jgi:hypothetical protein
MGAWQKSSLTPQALAHLRLDAGIFEQTNSHHEQDESSQDSPHLIQGVTEANEPLAHWTQGRLQRPQYIANMATEGVNWGESVADQEHTEHLSLQDRMRHPVTFLAEMCRDVMYFSQAICQQDGKQFVEAIVKEINGHMENQNWRLIKRSEVPEGEPIQQSVWAMQRKRNLTTGKIVKHKARLNLHGGMQEYGVNYYNTHALVVTWFAIRLMIVVGIIFNQAMRQIDFVMAYPQAPIEMDMYMEYHKAFKQSTEAPRIMFEAPAQYICTEASWPCVEPPSNCLTVGGWFHTVFD